jgi:hypothetical protein
VRKRTPITTPSTMAANTSADLKRRAIRSKATAIANKTSLISNSGIRIPSVPCAESAGGPGRRATAAAFHWHGAPSIAVVFRWQSAVLSGMVTVRAPMQRPAHAKRPDLSALILLALLVFRAYVPAGFMPASGTPFLLELCPASSALQMPQMPQMPAHHHHPDTHGHFENCPFGSASAAGPISHHVIFDSAGQSSPAPAIAFQPVRQGVRLPRAHQPRGPPTLA